MKHGYSDVYEDGGKPTITFGAPVRGNRGMVYVNADALMLTNIVNGEIGNLEGDMGAFYLAGVGKSFDYYMVNRDNLMITESRVYRNAILRRPGSEAPWKYTLQTIGVDCDSSGTYVTNVGAVTGCREAMGYYTGTNGSKMLGASMPYYDSEWTIVVEQTADELLAPLNSLLNHMFVISVVAGLIGFTLFIFLINFYIFRRLPKVLQK